MAYNSAYLSKVAGIGGRIGFSLWIYDTIDVTGDVDTAGYISDALDKGMRKGDLVLRRTWTTAVPTTNAMVKTAANVAAVLASGGWHWVMGVSTAGAADLSDVTAIAVTNTD